MIRASQIETARTSVAAPAAPARGARSIRGRGCGLLARPFGVFLLATLCSVALASSATSESPPLKAVKVEVPSGLDVALREVLLDESPGALWARFRFVAPWIRAKDKNSEAEADKILALTAADMDHLCESLVLDYLRDRSISPALVVLSFADRPVEFGVQDPDATQFFEAYRPQGESCIWEAF